MESKPVSLPKSNQPSPPKSEVEKMLDFLALAEKVGAVSPKKAKLSPPRKRKQ